MKKALFTLLAASLLAACGKNNDNVEVVFPEPATKAEAVSIEFNKGVELNLELPDRAKPSEPASAKPSDPVKVKIPEIELTEDGRYILFIEDKATKALADQKFVTVWSGRYTFDKASEIYKLDRFGEIKVDHVNAKVTIRPNDGLQVKAEGAEVSLAATISRINAASIIVANLARSWTVGSTYVKISGGQNNVSLSKSYKGCDLHEIATDLKDKGFALAGKDVDALVGYVISEFIFVGNGKMLMNFDTESPYYGNWEINGTNFSWSLNNSNKLIDAKASGNISFPSSGQALLVANAVVNAGNDKYIGTIEFTLNVAK